MLLFEDLVSNFNYFCNEIEHFFDNKISIEEIKQFLENRHENKRITKNYMFMKRISALPIIKDLKSSVSNSKKEAIKRKIINIGSKVEYKYSEDKLTFLNEYFDSSNKRLSEIIGKNTQKYNYPVI